MQERPWQLALKLVLIALMGLIVTWPLIQPELVCGDDWPGHLAHVVERDRLISQQIYFSRWAPDLAFGYGYPAFNFYPPLPHYLAIAVHRLGLSVTHALNLTMALAVMLAGPAMYLFVRAIFGESAGLVAGLCYAFAPYLAYNALRRFALNETLAMSLAPLMLWAFGRLGAHADRFPGRRVVLAAIVIAVLILTHPLMLLIFAPLLAGYLLVIWWSDGRPLALIGRVAIAGILAGGLTAFFWLPFITEIGQVQAWRATILDLTGGPLYPLHLVSLPDLLWPKTLWPAYATGNPLVQRLLSLPQVVLAATGLIAVRTRQPSSRLARAMAVLLGLTILIEAFLITPTAKPVWDNLRPLQVVQFPWRFLAPVSFSLAVLAGLGTAHLKSRMSTQNIRWVLVLDAVLLALLATWTLPWLHPFTCRIDTNPSTALLVWVDRNHIGGGSGGEFLPRTVKDPPTESPLEAALIAGQPLDRLDRASLPAGANVQVLSLRPLESTWAVASPSAFSAVIFNYFYPGWTVILDGIPAPIRPTLSTGLIMVDLSAGQHTLDLHLDSTRWQVLGNVLSLAGLIAVLALQMISTQYAVSNGNNSPVPNHEWAALAILGLILLIARLVLAGFAPPGAPLPSSVSRVSTDLGQVELVGYEISPARVQTSQPLMVTLYWQASSLLMTSYKSFVHVTDADGNLVAQSDGVPVNWTRPTTAWLPGEWIADTHVLNGLNPTLVRGPLQVWAGMYDPDTSRRLNPPGDSSGRIRLGTLAP
jgi:hypothetical protein